MEAVSSVSRQEFYRAQPPKTGLLLGQTITPPGDHCGPFKEPYETLRVVLVTALTAAYVWRYMGR